MPLSHITTRRAASIACAGIVALLAACSDDDTATTPAPPTTFTATLNGANEKPTATTSTATGSATVTFVGATSTTPATSGTYTVTVNGLTGAPTASHIHAPASTDQAAGVLVNFNPASVTTSSGTFSGTFTQTDITNPAVSVDSVLKLVRAGLAYVNVHTAANKAGEIRGQLVPKP
jgi:hypothetical protein